MFSLDYHCLHPLLSMAELLDLSCGAIGEGLYFPKLVIEHKSDCGPLYFVQNQVLGALRCIFEAQTVAQCKLDKTLPVLPFGIVNVGNWIEFWTCWHGGTEENVSSLWVLLLK